MRTFVLMVILSLGLGLTQVCTQGLAAEEPGREHGSSKDEAGNAVHRTDQAGKKPGRAEAPAQADQIAVRREYRFSIGPWSGTFSIPESIDFLDLLDRARGILGIMAILGVAVFLSENRRAISRRVVVWGLVLQWGFATPGAEGSGGNSRHAGGGYGGAGHPQLRSREARMVFGAALTDDQGPVGFVFAFRLLPTVIFVAALFAVLYHLGVMQWVVRLCAVIMARLMGTSGAESLNVAASLFLGQTEAPLTIRPYLINLTKSELLTVMTAGMAHVSGGIMAVYFAYGVEPRHIITAVIMTAPGAILLSKLLVPETEVPETLGHVRRSRTRAMPTCLTPRRGARVTACTCHSTSPPC